MATAIRDDNPVVFLHHYLLTLERAKCGREHLCRSASRGSPRSGDVTIVATGWMVPAFAGCRREARQRRHPGGSDRPAHGGAA